MQWRVLIPGALLLWSHCVVAQERPSFDIAKFRGQWMVMEIVGYADISGGEPEAKRLLGKKLDIRDDVIRFDKEGCNPTPGFRVRRVRLQAALLDDYGVSSLSLKLPKTTFMLDSANCTPAFILDPRSILFGSDGVMLRAERIPGAG